jgi:hypothetical protein
MKRIFLYARLESKVLSSKGKEIVRNYGVTIDAQAVCRDLARHHCPSTAASIAARDIIGFLISVTVGDERFTGTAAEFLAHWTQQTLYKIYGNSSTFSDGEKLAHLVGSVATISELRQ